MKKQPRRSPSSGHAPSLAWISLIALILAVAAGIGGLYAHRQNLEISKKHQLAELQRDIHELRDRNAIYQNEFEARIAATNLKLAIKEKKLPLRAMQSFQLRVLQEEANVSELYQPVTHLVVADNL